MLKHIAVLAIASLIPVSGIVDREKAVSLITPLINAVRTPSGGDRIEAAGFSLDGKEYIVAIDPAEESSGVDSITLYFSCKKNNIWQVPEIHRIHKYHKPGTTVNTHYYDGPATVVIAGRPYVNFSYNNVDIAGNYCEHIEVMIELPERKATLAAFGGKLYNGRKLEGKQLYVNVEEEDENAMEYMTDKMEKLSYLVRINESDALSDRVMEEWIAGNADASGNAGSVNFIPIPENCSIAEAFDQRKLGKETSGRFSALLMNFRGNTIICSADSDGSKKLVWCEPQCTDRTSGKYLHTIFFEQKSTIALFYYHGRKSFKYRINLDTGRITR